MAALGWKLVYGGSTPPPGAVVRPDERLSWGRTVGLGAQHVVAMFGATFVFPVIMGLSPNLAIMMSGFATIMFLLIVKNKVPSYLGTSASFVAGVAAIRAHKGADSADVTGAILIAGLVLLAVGILVHYAGPRVVHKVLPPAVTGAVVMLIGFNLAPVVAGTYWPQDQYVALLTMTFVILAAVLLPGFWGRIAVFLGLVFGYLISWGFDHIFGKINSLNPGLGHATLHDRVDWSGVKSAHWFGIPHHTTASVPGWHWPTFSGTFALLVLPSVIALIAENTGHVKAVAEMTGDDLNPYLGRALAGDGLGTAFASLFGGSPTTTYAENIGVMAATRVYSTAAYYVAGAVAILLGFIPKFGAIVDVTPGGVLGGITVVLYGMIGLLGAKIWKENGVDFANPINLVPLAAGIIAGIGGVTMHFNNSFELGGIALGTIVTIAAYHAVAYLAPRHLRDGIAAQRPAPRDVSLGEAGGLADSGVEDDVVTPPGQRRPQRSRAHRR
jgi:uracil-xanthine permease